MDAHPQVNALIMLHVTMDSASTHVQFVTPVHHWQNAEWLVMSLSAPVQTDSSGMQRQSAVHVSTC